MELEIYAHFHSIMFFKIEFGEKKERKMTESRVTALGRQSQAVTLCQLLKLQRRRKNFIFFQNLIFYPTVVVRSR